tara:strand:- start:12419 stop:13729 length:1311 start_codon:yes stop_codon:yes gene_type:complete
MANNVTWNEGNPENTDDVQEGALRIREVKQGTRERINRDHYFGGKEDPGAETAGADSLDTGYHRRVTIAEASSDRASTATTRINTVNQGTTLKMSEVWMQSQAMGGGTDQVIKYVGSNTTPKEVVTTAQTQTLTNKTLTAPSITNPTISGGSGNLDGVAIGANTASSGKFTTLESTGNTTIGDAVGDVIGLNGSTSGENRSSQSTKYPGAGKMNAGITGEIKMFGGANAPTGWLICDGSMVQKSDYEELFAVIGHTYTDTSAESSNGNQVTDNDASSNTCRFRLPNLQGRIPVGAGAGLQSNAVAGSNNKLTTSALSSRTLGYYGAAETHTLTSAESGVPAHKHDISDSELSHGHTIKGAITSNVGSGGAAQSPWVHLSDTAGPDSWSNDTVSMKSGVVQNGGPSGAETDNNTAADASSGHTQMQPWLAVHYIIKY